MVYQIPIDYDFYCELADIEMSSYIPKELILETLIANIRHTQYGESNTMIHDIVTSEDFTNKLINIMLQYPIDSNYSRVLDVCEYSIDVYVGNNYNKDKFEYKLYIQEPPELNDFLRNSCYNKNRIGSFNELKDLVLANIIREIYFDDYTELDDLLDFKTEEEKDTFHRIITEMQGSLEEETDTKLGNPAPIMLSAEYTGTYGNAIGIKVTCYAPDILYKGIDYAKIQDTKLLHI